MKKVISLLVMVTLILSMFVPVYAVEPVGNSAMMYADGYDAGDQVTVSLPAANIARLEPDNALGSFDALQSSGGAANQYFYALASHLWTSYTFEDDFVNVDGKPDITFCEVTWGSWHTEATKVYLSGAYVRDENGNVVQYTGDDDGHGYYAGIAWNKVGINGLTAEERETIAESYLPSTVTRTFETNTFSQDGNFGLSQFNLPEEVVFATDVTLVDITNEVYDLAGSGSTYSGNTDGYDLDAIRVYKYIPWRINDSATGCSNADGTGNRILAKGTWFMYNKYDGFKNTFDIQAGNPADGENIIGTLTIKNNDDGTFIVTYDMDETIEANGYIYNIDVVNEHLEISNTMSFTAKPGTDDNQDFGIKFGDADGEFYIFAHFTVQYK